MRMFDALFKGVSTQVGPLTIEKCIEHPHFISCSSFQNLRLGSINLQTKRMRMHEHMDRLCRVNGRANEPC